MRHRRLFHLPHRRLWAQSPLSLIYSVRDGPDKLLNWFADLTWVDERPEWQVPWAILRIYLRVTSFQTPLLDVITDLLSMNLYRGEGVSWPHTAREWARLVALWRGPVTRTYSINLAPVCVAVANRIPWDEEMPGRFVGSFRYPTSPLTIELDGHIRGPLVQELQAFIARMLPYMDLVLRSIRNDCLVCSGGQCVAQKSCMSNWLTWLTVRGTPQNLVCANYTATWSPRQMRIRWRAALLDKELSWRDDHPEVVVAS